MNTSFDPDDEDDNLPEPADFVRVVLGLTLLISGVLIAALFQSVWIKVLGFIIAFLLSPFIMLKWKKEFK